MTRALLEHWRRTDWWSVVSGWPVKCRRCRWVFPLGRYADQADVVGGLCAVCRLEVLTTTAKTGGAIMMLQDALMKSDHEMAVRTLPTGETVIGYMNGVGIVIGEQRGCLRPESREATSEELDAPAAWAPV